jgi:hypothetical protein
VNSPLTYNQVNIFASYIFSSLILIFFSISKLCFAYKASSAILSIILNVYLDGDTTTATNSYINLKTIADQQWHYLCVDMYQGVLNSWGSSSSLYGSYRITLVGVRFCS